MLHTSSGDGSRRCAFAQWPAAIAAPLMAYFKTLAQGKYVLFSMPRQAPAALTAHELAGGPPAYHLRGLGIVTRKSETPHLRPFRELYRLPKEKPTPATRGYATCTVA